MKNHKLTVVVTGSEGFIGKHLCAALEKHEDVKKVIKFDKMSRLRWNLCSLYDVQNHIANTEPDLVFHLASSTDVKYRKWDSSEQASNNIESTRILLEYLPKNCRVVFASSVHANYNKSLYAASKRACEHMLAAYSHMNLLETISLRLSSVVGKGMTHGVVKDFMTKLLSDNPSLDIIGENPGSIRPYIHIDDVVNAFIYYGLYKDTVNGEWYNVSTPDKLSVDEVSNIIMYCMKIHKPKNWLGASTTWLGDLRIIRGHENVERPKWGLKYPTSGSAIAQAVKDNL